jgi:predicted lipid-binding transport protein (Tim44 family)
VLAAAARHPRVLGLLAGLLAATLLLAGLLLAAALLVLTALAGIVGILRILWILAHATLSSCPSPNSDSADRKEKVPFI